MLPLAIFIFFSFAASLLVLSDQFFLDFDFRAFQILPFYSETLVIVTLETIFSADIGVSLLWHLWLEE